jgi:hypothetical protein
MQWNDSEPLSDSELDGMLREWTIEPPPQRLSSMKLPARRSSRIGRVPLPAAALALAALFAALFVAAKFSRQDRKVSEEASAFTPIPYTLPLGDGESTRVVRMEIPIAELAAAGFRLPPIDPSAVVTADVILGDDGRPRAVRLVKRVVTQN